MNRNQEQPRDNPRKRGGSFLGIHYVRCGSYGRIYKNKEGTAYTGNCPRCMHPIRVRIGSGGTGHRFFKCFCP
ncbi:MAG: hypothetical protein CMI26_01070 [Opitutae bacterium]|nr:hypothetical protein [Opitutae bacterium]